MWVGTQEPALLLCIPSDSEEVIPMPHFDRVKARAPFSCLLVQLIPSLIPFRWSSETRWLCYTQLPSNSSVHSERTTCRGSLVWNEPVLLALSKNLIETKLEKECFKKCFKAEVAGLRRSLKCYAASLLPDSSTRRLNSFMGHLWVVK